jgi:hypothetical protein
VDDRLAALRDEVDKILSHGPVGRWTNIPAVFPFNTDTVVFNSDGGGRITSWSTLSGSSVQTFTWSMETRGRIMMRYRLTQFTKHPDDDIAALGDAPELSPVTFGIEMVVQDTDVGSWPVLVSEGSDAFDCLRTALARIDPPLRLVEAAPALPASRSFLSRMRSLVPWPRSRAQSLRV